MMRKEPQGAEKKRDWFIFIIIILLYFAKGQQLPEVQWQVADDEDDDVKVMVVEEVGLWDTEMEYIKKNETRLADLTWQETIEKIMNN